MPPKKESDKPSSITRRRPAENIEAREQQMISYADELAERQLRDGTASAQVITHYLKLGTERDRLERDKIAHENLRIQAQIAQLQSQARAEDLIEEVLTHLRVYAGVDEDEDL